MGFVTDRHNYERIQNAILALCKPKFDPVDYEFVVWNLAHSKIDPIQQSKACRCMAA
jgi:hypothetical protein